MVGRILVVLGLLVALSALWMAHFYARPEYTGELLYLFRLAFGSSMAAFIILGFTAIHRRDIARHRAWMTRAYALAVAAGTQAFTQGFGEAILGTHEVTRDLLLGSAWIINLTIAEYIIRRRPGVDSPPDSARSWLDETGARPMGCLMTAQSLPALLRLIGHHRVVLVRALPHTRRPRPQAAVRQTSGPDAPPRTSRCRRSRDH